MLLLVAHFLIVADQNYYYMKNTLLIFCVGFSILFSSCKKNESFDNHSSSLMKSMHKMSDDMSKMTMTMDPDHDFAMIMTRHHEGAIEMSSYELANGTDVTIKAMAQTMKDAQAKEVATLDSFFYGCPRTLRN